MIHHLETQLPGELSYSICARSYDRVRYPNKRSFISELFGSGNLIAVYDLPANLDFLIQNLSPSYSITAEQIIKNNTLLGMVQI